MNNQSTSSCAFRQVRKHLSIAGFFPESEELLSYKKIQKEIYHDLKCIEKAMHYLEGEDEVEFLELEKGLYLRLSLMRDNIRKERLLLFKIKNYIINNFRTVLMGHYPSFFYQRSKYVDSIVKHLNSVYTKYLMEENQRLQRKLEFQNFININRHNYNLLENEDIPSDDEGVSDCEEAIEQSQRKIHRFVRKCSARYSENPIIHDRYVPPPIPQIRVRDLSLLDKIKTFLNISKLSRVGCWVTSNVNIIYNKYWAWSLSYDYGSVNYDFYPEIRYNFTPFQNKRERKLRFLLRNHLAEHYYTVNSDIAVHQMDRAKEEGLPNELDSKGNVDLGISNIEESVVANAPSCNWSSLASSDVKGKYTEMTDRWINYATFVWSKNSGVNSTVLESSLPFDAIANDKWDNCDMPNTIPFRVHRYWKGDMEVKVHLNSNKFQIGSLQVVWYYEHLLDNNFDARNNVYLASQNIHALISAGASNEVSFKIPFKRHQPFLHTKKRSDALDPLRLGSLYIRVLNPLLVSNKGPSVCYGSVFVRFTNCVFTGQINGRIDAAVPQMDIVGRMAEGALNALVCKNADNPPIVTPPVYVVPTASHSWSVGTGTGEPVNSLRMDPYGQTVHSVDTSYEMDVKSVAETYGLVRTLYWDKNHYKGSVLGIFDASPLLSSDQYTSFVANDGELTAYAIPPIGVVSSLFQYWRGHIKFRFDVVASQFHTGRILVGYVPGIVGNLITMEQLYASPHTVFSLNESSSFVFEVPFISDKPYWPRRYTSNYPDDTVNPPSKLFICVLNPLVPMETVASRCYINVYMCAGQGFEVCVPVQPCLGLGFNPKVMYNDSNLIHAERFYPYYIGYSDYTTIGPVKYCVMLDKLTTGIHFTNFPDNINNRFPIHVKPVQTKDNTFLVDGYIYEYTNQDEAPKYWDGKSLVPVVYCICVYCKIENTDENRYYLLPINRSHIKSTVEACAATIAVWMYKKNQFTTITDLFKKIDNSTLKSMFIQFVDGWKDKYTPSNPGLVPLLYRVTITVSGDMIVEDDYVAIHNIGEKPITDTRNVSKSFSTTKGGFSLFGENFMDLKNICRRYQLYTKLNINEKVVWIDNQCSFSIPLLPQGLDLDLGSNGSINEISNRCRDGPIPIVLSGYRYYRGSMRIRIVVPPNIPATCWVQHKPDRKLRSRLPVQCGSVDSAESLLNYGYSMYVQDLRLNSIIELEIPFYQNTMFGLLQRPVIVDTLEGYAFGLGQLNIGFNFVSLEEARKYNFQCNIFYSLADDFEATSFQGFPAMVVLDEIQVVKEVAVPQMGLISYLTKPVKDDIKNTVSEEVTNIVNVVTEKFSSVKSSFSEDIMDSSMFRCMITNLAHISVSQSFSSCAIGLVSILVEMKLLVTEKIAVATRYITEIFSALGISKPGNESKQPDVTIQPEVAVHNMDTSTISACGGLITLLFTGVCSLFSVGAVLNSKKSDKWSNFLLRDVKNVTSTGSAMLTFLKNILSVFSDMKEYVFGIVDSDYTILQKLAESEAAIKAWGMEVSFLCNPSYFESNKFKPGYHSRVNMCYLQGDLLFAQYLKLKTDKIYDVVFKLYEKICKLKEKLLEFGDDTLVRREPFVLWHYGLPGVGKSKIMSRIALDLLKSQNIRYDVSPFYFHNPSSEFWDACQNNPVMIVDDMFAVQEGEILQKQLAMLLAVVSPAILNPPKARLEDKGRPYNPEIFAINSNYDFVRFDHMNMDAIHRRRHILTKVVLVCKEKVEGCGHCEGKSLDKVDPKYLADYHHVRFQISEDVVRNRSYGEELTYNEYIEYLKEEYAKVRRFNIVKYSETVQEILSHIRENYEDDTSLSENFLLIRDKQLEKYKEVIDNSLYAKWSNLKVGDKLKNLNSEIKRIIFPAPVATPQNDNSDESVFDLCLQSVGLYSGARDLRARIFDCGFIVQYNEMRNFYRLLKNMAFWVSFQKKENRIDLNECCEKTRFFIFVFYLLGTRELYEEFIDKIRCIPKDKQSFINMRGEMKIKERHSFIFVNNMLTVMFSQGGYIVTDRCKHSIAPESADVSSEGYICGGGEILDYTCEQSCVFNYPLLKFIWLYQFLNGKVELRRIIDHVECVENQFTYKIPLSLAGLKIPILFRQDAVVEEEIMNSFQKAKVKLQAIIDWIGEKYDKYLIVQFAANMLATILAVAGVFLAACGIACVTGKIATAFGYNPEESAYSEEQEYRRRLINEWKDFREDAMGQSHSYQNVGKNVNINAKLPVAKTQSQIPQFDVAVKRVQSNFFKITAVYDDKTMSCVGVILYDRQLLLLLHYLEEFKALPKNTIFYGKYLSDKRDDHGVQFNFLEQNFKIYNAELFEGSVTTNLMLCDLPLKFPQGKDLTKFIATQKDHSLFCGDGVLVEHPFNIHQNLNIVRESTRPVTICEQGNSSTVVLRDMYTYRIQGRGMCGSLLLGRNLERPILGIHVAGVEKGNIRGIAEPLISESFKGISKLSSRVYDSYVLPNMTDSEFSKLAFDTHINIIGCSDKSAFQSSQTSFDKSLVYGVFPVRTEPNPLSPKDVRLPPNSSPLIKGIEHMGKPPSDFLNEDIKEAGFDLQSIIIQNVKPIRNKVGVISLQDVVCGNKNIDYFEPLEWSTSPGYPLRFLKDSQSQRGKKWLFDLDEENDGYVLKGFHPILSKQLAIDAECRKRNIKPFTVFIDCLKDTTLPIEKCSVPGKTRIFSISPVQFTIQFKQYFLDFMASYQKARFSAEHAIGIDVNSLEWTNVVDILQLKGKKIICGDYSNFGPGLMLCVAQEACNIILNWYKFYGDEQNNNIRRIMISEILGSYHMVSNLFYVAPCGIPSGSPITTPLNSLVNSLYIRIAWRYTTNLNYIQMHENISILTYGDDICMSVSDKVCDMFNTISIGNFFQNYNIKFTDYNKQGIDVKWRYLEDASFLKCVFLKHPNRVGVYMAGLDKISVEGCVNWVNKKNNLLKSTVENCEQGIMLAHSWGKDYYNNYIEKILKSGKDIQNFKIRYKSWLDLDRDRYSVI